MRWQTSGTDELKELKQHSTELNCYKLELLIIVYLKEEQESAVVEF